MYLKSSLTALLFERSSWTEGIHANLSREKPFLFFVNQQICIRFRKFSKRINVEWILNYFTFASQCKLFELLRYGESNHLFISVICFLETTHLSVHRFNSLIFSLVSDKVHPYHFSPVEENWSRQQSFRNTEKYIFE